MTPMKSSPKSSNQQSQISKKQLHIIASIAKQIANTSYIELNHIELAPSLVFVKIKLIYGGYVPKTATLFGVKLVGKIYGI